MDTDKSPCGSESDPTGEEEWEDEDLTKEERDKIISEAKDLHQSEGQVEIDDNAKISVSGDGG